jgi:hypothetical protein
MANKINAENINKKGCMNILLSVCVQKKCYQKKAKPDSFLILFLIRKKQKNGTYRKDGIRDL